MKPLTHCPYCKAPLIKKTIPEEFNPFKYENCNKRCTVDYFQYYTQSYDEPELYYITFYTPKDLFHIYTYFKPSFSIKAGTTNIYSNAITEKHGTSLPVFTFQDFKYDLNNLEKLEEKLNIWMLFS